MHFADLRGAQDAQRMLRARQDQPWSSPGHHQPVTGTAQGLREDPRTSNWENTASFHLSFVFVFLQLGITQKKKVKYGILFLH